TGGAKDWLKLTRIIRPGVLSLPKILAAADVRNPLLGARGDTRAFGAQKGAKPDQIELLEKALTKLADAVARDLGSNLRHEPGAGAAGGLGFGLLSFCGAELRPGFDVVADAISLRNKIRGADFVITGEGQLDAQTAEGKAPAGVAILGRKLGKPVYAIVGRAERTSRGSALFNAVFQLARPPV